MTDEKWQTLLDNFVRDATKVAELSKGQAKSRLNFILSEHTRRIVGELEGIKVEEDHDGPVWCERCKTLEPDDCDCSGWNDALDEAIKRIKIL